MKICGIYKITSPSGRIYIGQSLNIQLRYNNYKSRVDGRQPRLYNSFNKYGFENHVFEVIEQCEFNELNERERYWQDYYDVIGKNGLNCVLTKTSEKKNVVSDETRKKISKSLTNRPVSIESRLKVSLSNTGKKRSQDTIDLLRVINTGRRFSKEVNSKKGSKGNKNYFYGIRRCYGDNPKSKIVLNIETGIYYDSLKECAEELNINYGTLKSRLQGRCSNKTPFRYV